MPCWPGQLARRVGLVVRLASHRLWCPTQAPSEHQTRRFSLQDTHVFYFLKTPICLGTRSGLVRIAPVRPKMLATPKWGAGAALAAATAAASARPSQEAPSAQDAFSARYTERDMRATAAVVARLAAADVDASGGAPPKKRPSAAEAAPGADEAGLPKARALFRSKLVLVSKAVGRPRRSRSRSHRRGSSSNMS